MQQIADWLGEAQVLDNTPRVSPNDIDVSVLPYLTDADLEKSVSRSGIGAKFSRQSPSYPVQSRQNMQKSRGLSSRNPKRLLSAAKSR